MENYRFERVNKICEDLADLSTIRSLPITSWQMKEGFFLTPAEADAAPADWRAFDSNKDIWRYKTCQSGSV